jgi:predicted GIY-YIG superfamily endonuclease
MATPKRFVYILKSVSAEHEYYVGVTSAIEKRLEGHNERLSSYTARHRPWRTLVDIEFDDEEPAVKFERYLKPGSGREFARRHFRQTVPPLRAGRARIGSSSRTAGGLTELHCGVL